MPRSILLFPLPSLVRPTWRAALFAGCLLALTAHAQTGASNPMAPPACQCSAPTPLTPIATVVVHCVCGGLSCVIGEHKPSEGKSSKDAPATPLLQCVSRP